MSEEKRQPGLPVENRMEREAGPYMTFREQEVQFALELARALKEKHGEAPATGALQPKQEQALGYGQVACLEAAAYRAALEEIASRGCDGCFRTGNQEEECCYCDTVDFGEPKGMGWCPQCLAARALGKAHAEMLR